MPQNPPEGMPRCTPYLYYNDVSAALDWLSGTFGLSQRFSLPAKDGSIMHAEMGLEDAVIMIGTASAERQVQSPQNLGGVNQALFIYVDDVDAHYQHTKASGATILMEPDEMFWGDRIYAVADLEGHQWTFAQHVKDIPPEKMQLPADW